MTDATTTPEKTKATPKAAAPPLRRFIVLNDKGGIGKSTVVQALSLEMSAAGVDHLVLEAESDPRLARVLGPDRVRFFGLSDDSLRDIRRNPDLVAEFWDGVAEAFTADGVRLMDMGSNASSLWWRWWESGSGGLMLGDGAGTGALVVTTVETESLRLARETLARAAAEMPEARLFLVVSEHQGAVPAGSPVLDGVCAGAKARAAEVVRVVLPRCAAPAWNAMVGLGRPLNELAELKPQELAPLGFKLGAAARSVADVADWLREVRPQLRRILAEGGLVRGDG
jgi:hypothetical protein